MLAAPGTLGEETRWLELSLAESVAAATGTSIGIAGTTAIRIGSAASAAKDVAITRCRAEARAVLAKAVTARPPSTISVALATSDSSNELENNSAAPDRFGIITSSGSCAPG